MTLQTFLDLTVTIPEPTLRRAITLALAIERPTAREDYTRFYGRVLATLCAAPCTDGDPDSKQSSRVAA